MKPINWSRVFAYLPLYLLVAVLLLPQVHRITERNPFFISAYLFSLSFLMSFILIPFVIRLAQMLNILDHPNEVRKIHKDPTPLTGGLAIYIAFAVTVLLNFHFSVEMKGVLVASSLVFLVGFMEDWFGVSERLRLTAQIAATAILIMYGVRVTFVPDFLGGAFTETIITAVWIIGITNSMNFIDGMDGLASGTSVIYAIFFGIIAIATRQWYMMFLAIAIAGSCMGFFPSNFRKGGPAVIYLGDSGATFLGFLLASFALLGEWGKGLLDIMIPVLIMSVLIFDMTLTTIVRISTGEVRSIGQWLRYTGRDHVHHRLSQLGFGPKRAALLFFGVSVCFGLAAMAILFADLLTSAIILAHSILSFVILGIVLVSRNRQNASASGVHSSPGAERPA